MTIKFNLKFEFSVSEKTLDRVHRLTTALIALGILLLKSDGWL